MNPKIKIFFPRKLRSRIILTFTIVSVIIIAVTARVGYLFIKDIYLEQLNEQVNQYVSSIALQLDESYLKALPLGSLSPSSLEYFRNILQRNISNNSVQEVFIFDYNFNLVVHSNTNKNLNVVESRLLLNISEIDALDTGTSTTSLPFKGLDGKWYMWGFMRLSENHWLGVRENAYRLAKVEEFSLYFWLIGIAGVALTIIAGIILAGRIVSPINKLVKFSEQIGIRNFDYRKPDKITGELKILADAMETMKNSLLKHHKEKEQMLARIAHEIRNPLGGIELFANLTREDLIKDGKNPKYIEKILGEVAGLKELITAYLSYSKPVKPLPELCSIKKYISEVEQLLSKKIKQKDVKISVNGDPDNVWFDPGHFRNIIINIISNSIESIDKDGKIIVTTTGRNGVTSLTISDNGRGIDKPFQQDIFEPFFTTKSSGTGLGLAICRSLCEENNAIITLAVSNVNGTSFKIDIKNNHG